MKNIYINSQGGLGFNFALSHIIKELRESYDKVCILSPYFDVFEANPYVDYVYKPHEIRDFIFDAKFYDAKLICERMYDTEDFIYKKVSYADAWRKAAGLKLKGNKDGSDTRAKLDLSKYPELLKKADDIFGIIKKQYKNFVIMQFEGGQSPLIEVPFNDKGKKDWTKVMTNYDNEPLKRHYPYEKAKKFIKLFQAEHPDTAVLLYQLPNEHHYEGALQFELPYLTYYELAKNENCIGTVSIDSSLQHMVAGVTKSVVIWGHSLPLSFGYSYNKNIIQQCNRDDILYFSALGPSGARIDYIEPDVLLKEVNDYLF
ncbi:MAG: hypothetical protein K6E97_03515 [Treponema sp.]|nr:hypothetical protein [Treponema sp.]